MTPPLFSLPRGIDVKLIVYSLIMRYVHDFLPQRVKNDVLHVSEDKREGHTFFINILSRELIVIVCSKIRILLTYKVLETRYGITSFCILE